MSSGRAARLAAVILGVIAVALGVICGVIVIRTQSFLDDSSIATGEVIELISRQSCDEDDNNRGRTCTTVYAPRVQFTTADGREVVFLSDTAASPPSYSEGDRVEVRYRSENPSDAKIDSVMGVWLGAIVTGGLAFAFAAFCVVWVMLAVRFRSE